MKPRNYAATPSPDARGVTMQDSLCPVSMPNEDTFGVRFPKRHSPQRLAGPKPVVREWVVPIATPALSSS